MTTVMGDVLDQVLTMYHEAFVCDRRNIALTLPAHEYDALALEMMEQMVSMPNSIEVAWDGQMRLLGVPINRWPLAPHAESTRAVWPRPDGGYADA